MLNPFRALGKSVRDLFDDFLTLTVSNLLWALFTLPLWWVAVGALLQGFWLFAIAIALLGVLPAGPATAGLFYVAHRASDGRASKFGDFFTGLRQYARPGWAIVGVATASFLLIVYNLSFYLGVGSIVGGLMLGLWLYGLVFWLGLLLYAPALLFLQEEPSLRLVARNAFLMAVGRPIFTLLTLAMMVAIAVISTLLTVPVFLITVAFLALWSVNAARQLVEDARRRREAADADATAPPPEERGRKGQVRPK
jgi:uncharacterized membrane protein YesL